ncbi:thioredoxin domain-containing protein [Effusibacillus pohliae]|uniref:thioredoxin domain-containing protein n=1 Tax=Effusibacillus pohliae TaxID=232270 RepID=UPI00037AD2C3|nr:thioredoxin domain-containing protein [Effusibacillus pohliae]
MAGKEEKEPNRLIREKSPYLLQHAYNPVDWYPWGEEAFAKAHREDKPIFLSIGYSTCHWCHVMERESFEDEEVAACLNKHFISIKVDREERPDIDHIYMTVCQEMTGHGGWPLTIIMTPDKKPFFAGTYFPKLRKYGRPGLLDILSQIAEKWHTQRERILWAGERITQALQPRFQATDGDELTEEVLEAAFQRFVHKYDPTYGGFGAAPKFPSPHNFGFLLRYWRKTGDDRALSMVEHTLESMYHGGIYDHLGFGFARYSVDEMWLIPHFEKMLYDNALLAIAYLETYQATGNPFFAKVARDVFTYVLRDMTSPEGGFYSAEDADSEGEEGKFYVWRPEQIKQVLGERIGEIFCAYYGVTEQGNFEHGTSALNLIETDHQAVAKQFGLSSEDLSRMLEDARKKLFEARDKRVHPGKDDKILTAWNGLMIAALGKGARVLGDTRYADAARKAVEFILTKLIREDGRLLARYRDGEAAYPAYLDDYAFLIWGLLELYETDFDVRHIDRAIRLIDDGIRLFWDAEHGGFFFYGNDSEQLIARPKEIYDGAIPSGNSVMTLNLLRLARLTGNQAYEKMAGRQFKAFSDNVKSYPPGFTHMLMALQFAVYGSKEIVIAGDPAASDTQEMLRMVRGEFLPNAVVVLNPTGKEADMGERFPVVQGKKAIDGKATVYVCENYACQAPVTDAAELKQLLRV